MSFVCLVTGSQLSSPGWRQTYRDAIVCTTMLGFKEKKISIVQKNESFCTTVNDANTIPWDKAEKVRSGNKMLCVRQFSDAKAMRVHGKRLPQRAN